MKHQEFILAINANIFPQNPGSNLIEMELPVSELIIAQRAGLEQNPAYRQLIPYAILRHGVRYLAYRRTHTGGEARLHDKISIGFGGHIDLEDVVIASSVVDLESTARLACLRELEEELWLGGEPEKVSGVRPLPQPRQVVFHYGDQELDLLQHSSLIVASASAVDAVHVGLPFSVMVKHPTWVKANEDQIELVGWLTKEELLAHPGLESWSRIVLEQTAVTVESEELVAPRLLTE